MPSSNLKQDALRAESKAANHAQLRYWSPMVGLNETGRLYSYEFESTTCAVGTNCFQLDGDAVL